MPTAKDTRRRSPGPGRRGGGPVVRRGTARIPEEIARRVRVGHPWIYREAIGTRSLGRTGEVATLVDSGGGFLARGLIDGHASIAVRVVTLDEDCAVDGGLFADRVRRAYALRQQWVASPELTCFRVLNGESDGVPGVCATRFGEFVVVQFYTPATAVYEDAILDAIAEVTGARGVYRQNRYQTLAGKAPERNAELARGLAAPVEVEVLENGLRFLVDVTAPLSCGLFSDLRLGRESVLRRSEGARVINLFSYTGSLSVYARAGGAREVVSVDVAAKAHARARRNFSLNGFDPDGSEFVTGDALKVLAKMAQRSRTFDIAILDPPAFASASRGGKTFSATQDYPELVAAAAALLQPGGLLCAASASRKLTAVDFDRELADGARRAGRAIQVIERCGLPPDFPVAAGFPEDTYLKFVVGVVR